MSDSDRPIVAVLEGISPDVILPMPLLKEDSNLLSFFPK